MQLDNFHYELPDELIAHYPLAERSASRLLYLNKKSGAITHLHFTDLLSLLTPHDLLIFNNTQVIPARLLGKKASGGKIEVLVERILNTHQVLAHVRASKTPKLGTQLLLQDMISVTVIRREQELFVLEFDKQRTVLEWLEAYGHMPLPPYINRADEELDKSRYQTVYAQHKGAVAAPTAGLHFDNALLEQIKACGIATAFITLHVGAGTFQPVRVQNIYDHKMHVEFIEVNDQVCAQIAQAKSRGGRIIAVGTTSVRAIETAAKTGVIKSYQGDTDIFIYPGYQFKCIDALITNFHLPKSSLLMLVCAFGGYELIMAAYQAAIHERYRFYSYGDAMFIA